MRRLILAAVVALMPVASNAASLIAPEYTGKWCIADDPDSNPDSNWQRLRRGKCDDQYLILYKNGDYVLDTGAHTYRCKAVPKSYFKG